MCKFQFWTMCLYKTIFNKLYLEPGIWGIAVFKLVLGDWEVSSWLSWTLKIANIPQFSSHSSQTWSNHLGVRIIENEETTWPTGLASLIQTQSFINYNIFLRLNSLILNQGIIMVLWDIMVNEKQLVWMRMAHITPYIQMFV